MIEKLLTTGFNVVAMALFQEMPEVLNKKKFELLDYLSSAATRMQFKLVLIDSGRRARVNF